MGLVMKTSSTTFNFCRTKIKKRSGTRAWEKKTGSNVNGKIESKAEKRKVKHRKEKGVKKTAPATVKTLYKTNKDAPGCHRGCQRASVPTKGHKVNEYHLTKGK